MAFVPDVGMRLYRHLRRHIVWLIVLLALWPNGAAMNGAIALLIFARKCGVMLSGKAKRLLRRAEKMA